MNNVPLPALIEEYIRNMLDTKQPFHVRDMYKARLEDIVTQINKSFGAFKGTK